MKEARCQQLEQFIAEECKRQPPTNKYESDNVRIMGSTDAKQFQNQRLYEPYQEPWESFREVNENEMLSAD